MQKTRNQLNQKRRTRSGRAFSSAFAPAGDTPAGPVSETHSLYLSNQASGRLNFSERVPPRLSFLGTTAQTQYGRT